MGKLTKDWNKKRANPPKKEIKRSLIGRLYDKGEAKVKESYEYRMKVKAAEKEAYRETKLKEAKKFGAMKAKRETKRRMVAQSREFKGFAGPTQKGAMGGTDIAGAILGSSKSSKKKKKDFRMGDMGLY